MESLDSAAESSYSLYTQLKSTFNSFIPIDSFVDIAEQSVINTYSCDGSSIVTIAESSLSSCVDSALKSIYDIETSITQPDSDETTKLHFYSEMLDEDEISSEINSYSFFMDSDIVSIPRSDNATLYCNPTFSTDCDKKEDFFSSSSIVEALRSSFVSNQSPSCDISESMEVECSDETSSVVSLSGVISNSSMLYYPAAAFLHPSLPVDVSYRAKYDPASSLSIKSSSFSGFRRGIAIIIDTTIDETIKYFLDSEDGLVTSAINILRDISDMILSGLTPLDYFTILSTDGEYNGSLEASSDSCTHFRGLAKATPLTVSKARLSLADYFEGMNISSLQTLTVQDLSFSSFVNDAQSSISQAFQDAASLLFSSLTSNVGAQTVLREKLASSPLGSANINVSPSKMFNISSNRPLVSPSPLYIICISLGSLFPHSFSSFFYSNIDIHNTYNPIIPIFYRVSLASFAKDNGLVSGIHYIDNTEMTLRRIVKERNGIYELIDVSKYHELGGGSVHQNIDEISGVLDGLNLWYHGSESSILKGIDDRMTKFFTQHAFRLFRLLVDCPSEYLVNENGDTLCDPFYSSKLLPVVMVPTHGMLYNRQSIVLSKLVYTGDSFVTIFMQLDSKQLISLVSHPSISDMSYFSIFRPDGTILSHPILNSTGITPQQIQIDDLEQFHLSGTTSTGGSTFSDSIFGSTYSLNIDQGNITVDTIRYLYDGRFQDVSTTYFWKYIHKYDIIIVFSLASVDYSISILQPPIHRCEDIGVENPLIEGKFCSCDLVYGYISQAVESLQTKYDYILGYNVYPEDTLRSNIQLMRTHTATHVPPSDHNFDVINDIFGEDSPFLLNPLLIEEDFFQKASDDLSRNYSNPSNENASIFYETPIIEANIFSLLSPTFISSFSDLDEWDSNVLSIGVSGLSGIFISFPGESFDTSYSPLETPWFIQTKHSVEDLIITGPTNIFETTGFNMSQKILFDEQMIGVATIGLSIDTISDVFASSSLIDSSSSITYVITDSATVLQSSISSHTMLITEATASEEQIFLGALDPCVFQSLVSAEIIVKYSNVQ
ncbi:hypothetical protein ADUPG1_008179 [Aduncisulcus paluster]|uniref:Uncharacterized protein n=1 Tax=Aduncisulcus paluster TaxID=2918883 RepID=A0ABQ5KV62_9EUKA|nr:hypothetical protein ADUPG1_008179 [Aduncisulcus paluster]